MASKWLPGYVWNAKAHNYYKQGQRGFVKRDTILDLLETSISQRARDIRKGYEAVLSKELDTNTWLHRTALELKREHLELAALAAGGWDRLTPSDYGRIGGRLGFDYKHLAVMAQEIADGKVSLAQGLNRLDMYLGSARREYLDIEKNGLAAKVKDGYVLMAKRHLGYSEHCDDCVLMAKWNWRPADSVPIPGEGSACMTNCRCSMEYREVPLASVAEFNPYHDVLGRFAPSGGYAADTGGGGSATGHPIAKAKVTSGNLEDFPAYGKFGDETWVYAEGQGDGYLHEIQHDQGFDGPPHVVDNLDTYIEDGEIEVWRGEKKPEYAEQFRSGTLHTGQGVLGNGTYATTSKQEAAGYGDNLVRMTIKKGARVVRLGDLQDELTQDYRAASRAGSESKMVWQGDEGRFAAIKGYDIIDTGGVYVILNRTAVRVERAK